MRVEPAQMPGLVVVTSRTFPDDRGYLVQSWVKSDLEARGIPSTFAQAIQTVSHRGVVRGLHFQWEPPQGKYVRCLRGAVLDVVVDVRHGSPRLGDHVALELSDRNHLALWVPPGLAHGFCVLEDDAILLYECTTEWGPHGEGGIRWDDPALGIAWPTLPPIVSPKDQAAPRLADWLRDPRSQRFRFGG